MMPSDPGLVVRGAFGTRRIIDLAAAALLDTGRDVALMRAGGMIPMILRQALEHGAASSV